MIGDHVARQQWCGTGMVFAALYYQAFLKVGLWGLYAPGTQVVCVLALNWLSTRKPLLGFQVLLLKVFSLTVLLLVSKRSS